MHSSFAAQQNNINAKPAKLAPVPKDITQTKSHLIRLVTKQLPAIVCAGSLSLMLYRYGASTVRSLVTREVIMTHQQPALAADADTAANEEQFSEEAYESVSAFLDSDLVADFIGADSKLSRNVSAFDQEQRLLDDETADGAYGEEAYEKVAAFLDSDLVRDFLSKDSEVSADEGSMDVAEEVRDLVLGHDLFSDEHYRDNKKEIDAMTRMYGAFVETCAVSADPLVTVDHDDEVLRAADDIRVGQFLGVFSGVVTAHSDDAEHSWLYPGEVKDASGKPMKLLIDGSRADNVFKYLQPHPDQATNEQQELPLTDASLGNVEAFTVPHNNLWYIAFRAARNIQVGEVLTLDTANVDAENTAELMADQ